MRNSGFVFMIGHTDGSSQIVSTGDLSRILRWSAAAAGTVMALIGTGFLWGKLSRR